MSVLKLALIFLTLVPTLATRKCWSDSSTDEHHTNSKKEITCSCGDYCYKWKSPIGIYTWGCSCSAAGEMCPRKSQTCSCGKGCAKYYNVDQQQWYWGCSCFYDYNQQKDVEYCPNGNPIRDQMYCCSKDLCNSTTPKLGFL
ncbi:unnamed protein product, partial [Mesorhabditis belari]|uniref:Uncharacterized protein n=1 Tax=Mesorhabditis belari TaxID=2138241 RepID=A0AAF3FQ03_9BILA